MSSNRNKVHDTKSDNKCKLDHVTSLIDNREILNMQRGLLLNLL